MLQLEEAGKEQWSDQSFPPSYYAQGTAESNRDLTENWLWVNADAGCGSGGENKEAGSVENSMTDSWISSAEGIFRNEIYLLELSGR